MTQGATAISFVVLAKETSAAKTRLLLDRERAGDLAAQMALRTIATAIGAASVHDVFVVTSDVVIANDASALGAHVVPEGKPVGIVGAAALGRRRALATHPRNPVAIMVADLPLLTEGDLDAAAAEYAELRAPMFVADHRADGTTCLIHDADHRPGIAFGWNSAQMHRKLGYVGAVRPLRGLRVDLDTPEDLALVGQASWRADAPR